MMRFPLPAKPGFVPDSLPADTSSSITTLPEPVAGPSRIPIDADPTKCAICSTPPKYTCPRCSLRTCSLACSKSHKTKFSCSGERDPGAFVSLAKYQQGDWGADYAFLEEGRRKVGEWGKGVNDDEVRRIEKVHREQERMVRRRRAAERERERLAEEEEERRKEEMKPKLAPSGWGHAMSFLPPRPGQAPVSSEPEKVVAPLPPSIPSQRHAVQRSARPIRQHKPGPAYLQEDSPVDIATAIALSRGDDSAGVAEGLGKGRQPRHVMGKPAKSPNLLELTAEMRRRGIWVEFMPDGMERRKINQSSYKPGNQELCLTVQIMLPLDILASPRTGTSPASEGASGAEGSSSPSIQSTHGKITHHIIVSTPAPKVPRPTDPSARLTKHAQRKARMKAIKEAISKLPTLRSLLPPLAPSIDTSSLSFILPFHPSPARQLPRATTITSTAASSGSSSTPAAAKGKPFFTPLDPTRPIAEVLKGTAFVEFPIVHVMRKEEWERMVVQGKAIVVPLAQPLKRGPGDTDSGAAAKRAKPHRMPGKGPNGVTRSRAGTATGSARASQASSMPPPPPPSTTKTVSESTGTLAKQALPKPPIELGLGGLGGYGSDSDVEEAEEAEDLVEQATQPEVCDAQAEKEDGEIGDEDNEEGQDDADGDAGYYDPPSDGEQEEEDVGVVDTSTVASADRQVDGIEKEVLETLAGGAEIEGLSGEMLVAVGEALAADLS